MGTPLSGGVALATGHAGVADLGFAAVLALAGLGSAVVLALALAALVRRRSRSYLLVALALSTLLARTAVATVSLTGGLGAGTHHALEHGLDVVMAALVIAAVYDARSARHTADVGGRGAGNARSAGDARNRGASREEGTDR